MPQTGDCVDQVRGFLSCTPLFAANRVVESMLLLDWQFRKFSLLTLVILHMWVTFFLGGEEE